MYQFEVVENELINEIEKLKSPKGYLYAGLPLFKGIFGRDSLASAWQLLDYDPEIAKSTLSELSKVQGKCINRVTGEEPGKICHEYYDLDTDDAWYQEHKGSIDWLKKGVPVYYSVDSTPLYLIVFEKYFEKTNDLELLTQLWPSLKAAILWILEYGIVDRFVRYNSEKNGLKCQSWKDGMGKPGEALCGSVAVVEVQGYAYLALNIGSKFANIMKDYDLEEKCENVARKLKNDFNEMFWNDEKEFYYFALDGKNKKTDMMTSNPGHLLFTGICDGEKAQKVKDRLFSDEFITDFGIRTLSTDDSNLDLNDYQLGTVWPYDNWMIAQGLKSVEDRSKYEKIVNGIVSVKRLTNNVPEYYGVSKDGEFYLDDLYQEPCCPQAWSTCALLNFEMEKKVLAL